MDAMDRLRAQKQQLERTRRERDAAERDEERRRRERSFAAGKAWGEGHANYEQLRAVGMARVGDPATKEGWLRHLSVRQADGHDPDGFVAGAMAVLDAVDPEDAPADGEPMWRRLGRAANFRQVQDTLSKERSDELARLAIIGSRDRPSQRPLTSS